MSPLLDLEVENLQFQSVPFHGTGNIEQLLNTFTGWWILRLVNIRSALISQGLPSASVTTLQALIDYLAEMRPAQARATVQDPIFAAWLSRLWNNVFEPQKKGAEKLPEWLPRHIDQLQIIFLTEISRFRAFGAPTAPITIGPDQNLDPLNVHWRLRRAATPERSVELLDDGTHVTLVSAKTVLACIPQVELRPGADGGSIETIADVFRVEQRSFLLNGQVEVFPDDAFPELSDRRSSQETRSTLCQEALGMELGRAIELIRRVWPEALDDVTTLFRGLLPIQMAGGGWNSASTGQAPFVLQLTFQENGWPFLLADSILHECAHTKLDMALTLGPLFLNDEQKIYRHPWRPDLRPMVGVLLGAHAFLAVLTLYHRGLRIWPDDEAILQQYEQRRAEVETAMSVISEHANFTAAGVEVFEAMRNSLADCRQI
jgi:hypothetical protein